MGTAESVHHGASGHGGQGSAYAVGGGGGGGGGRGAVAQRDPDDTTVWRGYNLSISEIMRLANIPNPVGCEHEVELLPNGNLRIQVKTQIGKTVHG